MYEQNLNQNNFDHNNVSQEPRNKNNFGKYVIVFLISLLFVGNVGAFYYIFTNNKQKNELKEIENIKQENLDNNSTSTEEITLKDGEILVEWNEWPVKRTTWDIFDYKTVEAQLRGDSYFEALNKELSGFMYDAFEIYKVGKIIKGQYVNNDLYIVMYQPEAPVRMSMLRVIKDGNNLIVLGKYSDNPEDFYKKLFTIDNNIVIANLETPDSIKIPNSSFVLEKTPVEPSKLMTEYDNPIQLFKYDDKNYIYKDRVSNCFIVRANDGTIREYYFNLNFLGQKMTNNKIANATPYKLDITWSDGTKNTNEYIFNTMTGCGGTGCYSYADYITDNDLKEIGKTSTDDPIYALKDNNFAGKLKLMYDEYYPGYDAKTQKPITKISFEKFVVEKPLIFWKDPFGQFIELNNAKYLPAVECGKPVIYLYPTKTTDVTVKVFPGGGFTITEPIYNDGWFVRATKNSELYNYKDKTTYPYLFWEGLGLNYERPNNGFVVAKNDVEKFLKEKLSQFGLIEKEYNEFIEFWLPKMQEKNYYFITFVPQEEFDKLAPLSVNPKPDTIIRVFMDFEGLDNYVSVKPQIIKNTPRIGFTVVEWGGALHK